MRDFPGQFWDIPVRCRNSTWQRRTDSTELNSDEPRVKVISFSNHFCTTVCYVFSKCLSRWYSATTRSSTFIDSCDFLVNILYTSICTDYMPPCYVNKLRYTPCYVNTLEHRNNTFLALYLAQ